MASCASLPHSIAYGLIGKHVALSGKELTPHRSSISAQACVAGHAECSMRSRLSIPAPPGRATRLRMLLRTRMSRAARASLPHSLADGAFGRPGTICRAAGEYICAAEQHRATSHVCPKRAWPALAPVTPLPKPHHQQQSARSHSAVGRSVLPFCKRNFNHSIGIRIK